MNIIPGQGIVLVALADFFFVVKRGKLYIGQYAAMLGAIARDAVKLGYGQLKLATAKAGNILTVPLPKL